MVNNVPTQGDIIKINLELLKKVVVIFQSNNN